MTIWYPDIESRAEPRYLAIANALEEDIAGGRLAPADRLPTHRDLAEHLKVTVGTVSRAYAEAERRGHLYAVVGKGTFIREPAESQLGYDVDADLDTDQVIDLSINRPAIGPVHKALSETLLSLAGDRGIRALMNYQPAGGQMRDRRAAASWIERSGLTAGADRVALTCGAQHGIAVSLAASTRPGDGVVVESLTYPGIKGVIRQLGRRLLSVDIDDFGIVPQALERICVNRKPRALVCAPTLQNPTASVLNQDRREQIASIAGRHDLTIIEDDVYGFLVPEAPAPLAALAADHCCYITSLSKCTMPGLRIGYVLAPEHMISEINHAVRNTVLMSTPMMAAISTRWIEDGTAERLADWQRHEAIARQDIAREILQKWEIHTHRAAFHVFLHLPPAWRASEFIGAARAHGIVLGAAGTFAANRDAAPHAVRICLSSANGRERLRSGLEILARLLQETGDNSTVMV